MQQQLAQEAGAQAQQAAQQATAWQTEASNKAAALAEVELKLQQVGCSISLCIVLGKHATAGT